MRTVVLLCCLLFVTACDESPVGPTIPSGEPFTIGLNQTAVVSGPSLELQFVAVTGDSRCPADAICIQGGDAVVRIRVRGAGGSGDYELHTGDSARATVDHRGYRITLLQLDPYPFASKPFDPREYRATLRVTG